MELSPVFARRLYIALLIKDVDRPNVPKLMAITGWPRRTIQDVLKALPAIGIDLSFVQDGRRHNDGYYTVNNWGPFDVRVLKKWKTDIASFLSLPAKL
ncbi:helix-turn-helix domain-containing protein [Vibrio aphrogenes]|uniref:helix-turn-helix domain-containing protein n=1 Tax=Vibrio aphrogenes TaxID=1891186 RepID=UPI000B350A06|nr:helix-turn-helix domain-containing protein [Vibrio aphrogenes]